MRLYWVSICFAYRYRARMSESQRLGSDIKVLFGDFFFQEKVTQQVAPPLTVLLRMAVLSISPLMSFSLT